MKSLANIGHSLYIETGAVFKADVASVAVMDGTKILMGQRRDNQKWTTPGGHLDPGETKEEGAKRELKEEAGIDADKGSLKFLVSEPVTTFTGKKKIIHAFICRIKGAKPTSKYDPDHEVKKWLWIETKNGLPEKVKVNLHSPKNVLLRNLGLSKSFYVLDLIKGGPHKYIRKYRRGQNWVYIYHEPGQHGRAIPEEAVHHVRELAELGDEHAKALHDSIQEHDEGKLKTLRKLADLGDDEAHTHLKTLGIDRHKERFEESIVPKLSAPPKDLIHKRLPIMEQAKAHDAVQGAVKAAIFGYLSGHGTSPYATSLAQKGVTIESIMAQVKNDSVADILSSLHTALKKVDEAHVGLPGTQNATARDAGGYGNHAYNSAVKELESKGILPEGYATEHKRDKDDPDFKPMKAGELAEKAEKRRKEAAEAAKRQAESDRRDLAEISSSMAYHMASMMEDSRDRVHQTKELHKALKNIFGHNLKKEDWPYDFDAHGLTTKIKTVLTGRESVEMELQVYDKDGNPMMNGWRRTWRKDSDGRPRISNDFMEVSSGARTGVQVGSLINAGQRKLMRAQPNGGTVAVHANIDVGGYNWANQGFSWTSRAQTDSFRQRFQLFLKEKGIELTDNDMKHFKEPVHFAAFDDGKKYVKDLRNPVKLSREQITAKSLSGVEGELPLTPEEIRQGKAYRMSCHLGKAFMLGTDWFGDWDSAKDTEASKFADQYLQLRERATQHLSAEYRNTAKETKAGQRTYVARRDERPVTARASVGASPQAQRYLDHWRPRGTGRSNITMTQARLNRMKRWETSDINSFLRHAPLTSGGKRQIQELLRGRANGNDIPF